MTITALRRFFLVCLLINYGILLLWFFMIVLAKEWLRGFHGKWFPLSGERFDAIHYQGMAIYKIGIFLLNLGPCLALLCVEDS